MTTANEFLLAGGVTSAKFPEPGTSVTGTITREPEVQQQRDFTTGEPKFWEDGKPMQQLQIILDTAERDPSVPDDDGQRAIYVKGNMLKAVREAIRKAGAKEGIKVGGTLQVTYTGDGETSKRGLNPPKLYSVVYTPPAGAANEFLTGQDQQQTPTAQPQPAAPAPAAPAAPGVSAEALAALQQLTPEQRKLLGIT